MLKWLYFERLRSYMTETYTTFTLLSLLPWWTVSFLFLAIMVKNISWLQWNKKNIFTSSKLQKTSILWLQIIWGLDIPGSKFGVLEIPTLSLLEKRRKTWRSLNKSMKDNSTTQIWSKLSNKLFQFYLNLSFKMVKIIQKLKLRFPLLMI